MATFTSSGNSTANNFDFGSTGYQSNGVILTDGLTPDFTGTYATSITLAIRADAATSDAGAGTAKGFVKPASGDAVFGSSISFSYVSHASAFSNVEFDLTSVSERLIEDNGMVGIIITDGTGLEQEAWDNTNQSSDWTAKRCNAEIESCSTIRHQTVTIVSSATAPTSNVTFPQIPEPKSIKNSVFNA